MINQICSHIVLQEIFVLILIIITKKKKKSKQNKTKPTKIYNTKQRNIIRFLCRKKQQKPQT